MNAKEKLADYQRQFGVYAEANPEVMGAFGATVTAAMENSGSLDAKTMELLILVAAVSRKCEPCIYSHVMNYINAGGTKEDLAAGLNAAVLICGGPGMAYSALARISLISIPQNSICSFNLKDLSWIMFPQ